MYKRQPLPPVITLLSALFAMVACAGNEVKFAPLPLNDVAVMIPAYIACPFDSNVIPVQTTIFAAFRVTVLPLPIGCIVSTLRIDIYLFNYL